MATGKMRLSKFIDGSIAKTVVMNDTELKVMTFDQNIFQDSGLYAQMVNSECSYTTSTASIRKVSNIEGDTIYFIRKDLETEKGIHYEVKPKYGQNLTNNRKSRFVHYSAANAIEGDRQTFNYAYLSAIKAVKEMFSSRYSNYFVDKYDLYEDGGENRIKTLLKLYLPTDELVKDITQHKESNKYRFTLLCILSLYYLQKTFTLNRLEISQYDKNCEYIMRYYEDMQSIFTEDEKNAYLDFLYLISIGKYIEVNSEGEMRFISSRQTRFFYDIDCDRPITFQGVAIDGSQIQLNSVIERLAEDISIILGYHYLTMAPYSKRVDNEVYNIIEYFVYPNIVDSPVYRECVLKLSNDLHDCDNEKKLETYNKIAMGIEVSDSETLPLALAKDIVKKLYSTYPNRYINYIRFCRSELPMSKIIISPQANSIKDPYTYIISLKEAVEDTTMVLDVNQQNDTSEPEGILKLGYTFIERDLDDVLASTNITRKSLSDQGILPTEINTGYSLNYNPAWYPMFNKGILSSVDIRKNKDRSRSISRYEFLYEVIRNLAMAIENLPKTAKLCLDSEKVTEALTKYMDICCAKSKTNSTYYQNWHKANRILEHMNKYGSLVRLTRVVTHKQVNYNIEADIFTLRNIAPFLTSAIKESKTFEREVEVIDENITNSRSQGTYKILIEASRQLLYFYSNFLKDYGSYEDTESFIDGLKERDEDPIDTPEYEFIEENIIDTWFVRDNMHALANNGNLEFIEGFKELDKYVARTDNLFCLHDCCIDAYPERKIYVTGTKSVKGSLDLRVDTFWEPSYLKVNFSIPFPEYIKLTNNSQQKYTIALDKTVPYIKAFK